MGSLQLKDYLPDGTNEKIREIFRDAGERVSVDELLPMVRDAFFVGSGCFCRC